MLYLFHSINALIIFSTPYQVGLISVWIYKYLLLDNMIMKSIKVFVLNSLKSPYANSEFIQQVKLALGKYKLWLHCTLAQSLE